MLTRWELSGKSKESGEAVARFQVVGCSDVLFSSLDRSNLSLGYLILSMWSIENEIVRGILFETFFVTLSIIGHLFREGL